MKKEVTSDEAIGKTIGRFIHSFVTGQMIIVFSDESFTAFKAVVDCNADPEIINKNLDLLSFGDELLITTGFVTEEYMYKKRKEYIEKDSRRNKEEHEKRERNEYERLRAKFEGK